MSLFGGSINNTEVTKASFFTNYVPTVSNPSGTISAQIVSARYIQLGKLVYLEIFLIINAVTGASPVLQISLPFIAETQGGTFSPVVINGFEQNTLKFCYGATVANGIIQVQFYDGTTTATVGNVIRLTGWYSRK